MAALAGLLGVVFLSGGSAATYVADFEAEAGTPAGAATAGLMAGASEDRAVHFGGGGAPPPGPTPPTPPPTPIPACTRYVSTAGNDTSAGSTTAPWRGVGASLAKLEPGDVLCLKPGTYTEEVGLAPPDGTAAARITVRSEDAANRALIDGRFSLSNVSYWTIRDLRFTNPTPTVADNINARVFAMIGGSDNIIEHNEMFDSRYAGVLIGRAGASSEVPMRYTFRHNYVHDTDSAGFYFNPSRYSDGNLIERNVIVNSGSENLKVGWGGDELCAGTNWEAFGAGGTEVRYNTFHNGGFAGSLVIAEPGGLHDIRVHHNIISDPQSERGFPVRYDSTEGCLGDKVYITDNIGFGGTRFSNDFGSSPVNVSHEARNVYPADPQFDAAWRPQNDAAKAYGAFAE